MAEILLMNPRRRRRRKTTARRRRRAPARAAAPRRRRRTRRAAAPVARRTRRRTYRRNPIRGGVRGMRHHVNLALSGAAGALGADVIAGYLPIPANLKFGPLGYVTKGAIAFGMGWAVQTLGIARRATAHEFTRGALTVVLHEAMRGAMMTYLPQVRLGAYLDSGGLGYTGSGLNPEILDENGMGAYLPGNIDTSYMNAGWTAGSGVGVDGMGLVDMDWYQDY